MNLTFRCVSVVLTSVLFTTAGFGQNRTFTSQYSFGDSLSDNGNLYGLTGRTQPASPPYYNGRFSNGPVFVELLGNDLAPAALISAKRGNLDFAFGGATAGSGSAVPTLSQQIAQYAMQGLPATRTDLFTVLAGANDLIGVLSAPSTATNPAAVDPASTATAQAVASGVRSLVSLGAKNIVVCGLPNLGQTPRSITAGSAAMSLSQRASMGFNTELRNQLRAIAASAPDVNLVYVDIQGVLDRIIQDYRALGYSNATAAYLATSGVVDPNSMVFFDDIHPTAKTHALVAAVVTEELNPEPVLGFAATEGTAALTLAGIASGAVSDRLAQVVSSQRPDGRADAYASYNYGDGNRAADGWRQKFSYTAQVVTAGADLQAGDGFVAGAAASVGRLSSSLGGGRGNFAVEEPGARLYGAWMGGPVVLSVDGGYGVVTIKGIHRTTALGGFQTNGKTSGDHWDAGMRVTWLALDHGSIGVRPWVGLRTERVKLHAYTEKDVPSLAMAFDAQEAKSNALAGGVDLSIVTKVVGHLLRFDGHAAWHGEISSKDRIVSGRLADNFTLPTEIDVRDGNGQGVEIGGMASLTFAKNWSASLGYVGDVRSGEKLASRAIFSVQTGF